MSSTPTDQPRRKPAGQMYSASGAVRSAVADQQIRDDVRDPAPPKRGKVTPFPPIFLAHACCGQTAGWIKMPFGMEVGLGSGHTVLDGDPTPKTALNFRPMSVVDKRLDGSRCHLVQGRPRSRPHCVRWGPSLPQKGAQPSQFSAHVYCDQTVAHLGYC